MGETKHMAPAPQGQMCNVENSEGEKENWKTGLGTITTPRAKLGSWEWVQQKYEHGVAENYDASEL